MASNLTQFHAVRDSFEGLDKLKFEAFFIGYLSPSVSPEVWAEAIEKAKGHAARTEAAA